MKRIILPLLSLIGLGVLACLGLAYGGRNAEILTFGHGSFAIAIGAIFLLLICGAVYFLVKRTDKEFRELLEFMKSSAMQ